MRLRIDVLWAGNKVAEKWLEKKKALLAREDRLTRMRLIFHRNCELADSCAVERASDTQNAEIPAIVSIPFFLSFFESAYFFVLVKGSRTALEMAHSLLGSSRKKVLSRIVVALEQESL